MSPTGGLKAIVAFNLNNVECKLLVNVQMRVPVMIAAGLKPKNR